MFLFFLNYSLSLWLLFSLLMSLIISTQPLSLLQVTILSHFFVPATAEELTRAQVQSLANGSKKRNTHLTRAKNSCESNFGF